MRASIFQLLFKELIDVHTFSLQIVDFAQTAFIEAIGESFVRQHFAFSKLSSSLVVSSSSDDFKRI